MVKRIEMESRRFDVVGKPLLITSSLIDGIEFHATCPPTSDWKTKSLIDLKGQLKRAPWSGDAIFTERGREFEDKVVALSRLSSKDAFCKAFDALCLEPEIAQKLGIFYDRAHGAQFQKVMKKDVEIQGQKFFFYGKADAVFAKPRLHVDFKTTSSPWKDDSDRFSSRAKYEGRSQHMFYMTIDGVNDFVYTIAQFINIGTEKKPEWRIVDVHEVAIHEDNLAQMAEDLNARIMRAVNFIADDPEMWSDYCNVFTKSW